MSAPLSLTIFWVWAVFLVHSVSQQDVPGRKFEYKFSFKGPYLSQKDGSVPFWQYSGNAIASDESVRITPSLRSQKGQIWSKQKTDFEWWEVELVFRVSGRGRVGADGLGFWFTEARGREGPVFGSSDAWKGLGIFFDSFDNDNKHNNPYVMAVLNDGTMRFDHQNDGVTQQLAGCLRDYRNKPFPVRAKIEYLRNVLTVQIHNGITNNPNDYEMCFRAENVHLPPSGYFGVSAATGGLADDHDVLKFLTHSLHPGISSNLPHGQLSEAEKHKLEQEYENFQQKLDSERKAYHEKHPEAKKDEGHDYEWFEEEQTRELRQIFQGQGNMMQALQDLHRKGGMVPPPAVGTNVMQRHEVEQLLGATRELLQLGRDIKAYTVEIHQKSSELINNQARQPVGQGSVQPIGYDVHAVMNELKESVHSLKRDLGKGSVAPCDVSQIKCLSVSFFLMLLVIQTCALAGLYVWKSSRENNLKKFY
ncbi:unnamed protein product [Notodromas monacha]|uniref:L-type lectin-like domain-containing protein n=1 Tax=Notodromas monacha TaxID=399045 RepID=A0A7R9BQ56_9CRUS|nr:unnamed protein product [Notodromas monacha]CAG0919605.1 unnamed protein product [Notodromas monacha]